MSVRLTAVNLTVAARKIDPVRNPIIVNNSKAIDQFAMQVTQGNAISPESLGFISFQVTLQIWDICFSLDSTNDDFKIRFN